MLAVKLNGRNYSLWEFQFRFLIQGKDLLAYLDGSVKKPAEDATSAAKTTWNTKNAQVISHLLHCMEPHIALTLRTFNTASKIWTHLKKTYGLVNSSRLFEVEYELARLQQGDLDVTSFLNATQQLWTEQDILSTSLLSKTASEEIQKERHRSRVLQFLMKLRPEFEQVRSSLITTNVTDLDAILGDLLRTVTRLSTQAKLDGSSSDQGSVFAVNHGRPQFISSPQSRSSSTALAYGDSGRTPTATSSELRCRHCGEVGHPVSLCRKRNFCNYCKRSGHIISECRSKQ
ncbi:hypothetical protein LINGRAHAP2_LOCUS4941 [Linum grandiflorum]